MSLDGVRTYQQWCEALMPYTEVMHKWKAGKLHSGSKTGPIVKSQKQAVAIKLSEKRTSKSKPEYRPSNKRGILG